MRAFGIPTIARPSRGHAALAHWTPRGWVVNLGPRWGGGWTKTVYDRDKDFLASTQARVDQEAYFQVKRAQWIGDVMGEKRVYGESGDKPAFWNALSLKTQRQIIEASKAVTLEALGTELGESNQTEAEWEYACRAGSTTKWFFGDDVSMLGDYAWYEKNDGGKSHPVGQKKPNPWGLYDIYGNVCERVSDTYSKDYYAKGPKVDPTGPQQAEKSRMTFEINVPKAGNYALTAKVVTANYDQTIVVSANGSDSEATLVMPFTKGSWQESEPVVMALKAGANTLDFLRRDPPQYGVAIKSFTLTPVK